MLNYSPKPEGFPIALYDVRGFLRFALFGDRAGNAIAVLMRLRTRI
jgi:hypothetical protein